MAEKTLRARFVTRRTGPPAGTDAITGNRIARGIVVAGADLIARLAVIAQRTPAFAPNTTPVHFANAFSSGSIASQRILQMAVTALRTILTKPTRITLLLAPIPIPPSRACTLTVNRITDATVCAITPLGAIFAIVVGVAGSIASDSLPTGCTEALATFRCTDSSVHTLTTLAAALTVGSIAALLLAVFSLEARNAITRSINVIARRIILAVAVNQAILPVPQELTWSVARSTAPAWLAETFSGPRMTHFCIVSIAFTLSAAVLPKPIIWTNP